MNGKKRWGVVTALIATVVIGLPAVAIAQSTNQGPTKQEALAELDKAQRSIDIARDYIAKLPDSPAPTTTTPPPPTTTTPPPTNTNGTAAGANNWGSPKWTYEFASVNELRSWGLYQDPGNQHGNRQPSQCTVENGNLVLRSLPDRRTCGMSDNAHRGIKYGRIETRVKSEGSGWKSLHIVWPDSDVWPRDGEYDFREHTAGARCYTGFLHYPGHTPKVQEQLPENAVSCVDTSQWHNVAYEWTPQRMKGWVDGKLWYDIACNADLCDMPAGHLTIQNDDQGQGRGNTATTYVDWIRFYPIS